MDKNRARQLIADFASDFSGSHYLWGAGGSTPGNADGVFYRAAVVTLHPAQTDPKDPKIFTATCSVDGKSVCAGRFKKIRGGRLANSTDQDLVAYLNGLAGQKPDQWEPYFQWFSPRMMEGKKLSRQLVWGEDCRARRHFDCISFVNFVLSRTTIRSNWSMNIDQYNAQTQEVDRRAPPVAGDILTRGNHHIGLLDSDGQVIQAEDSANGVHGETRYNPMEWSRRGRLADSLLR